VLRVRRRRLGSVALAALVLSATLAGSALPGATAPANLVQNASIEQFTGTQPTCWGPLGTGSSTASFGVGQGPAGAGDHALSLTVTGYAEGWRVWAMAETPACAPQVVSGHVYTLSGVYTATTAATAITIISHTSAGWRYWTQAAKTLPVARTFAGYSALTPPIPSGVDEIAWGLSLHGNGTVVTDDYLMVDRAVTIGCGGPAVGCGSWQVAPYQSAVRAIHAVLLGTGRVLLVAGSGNNPMTFAAGTFKSTLWDPVAGTFTSLTTPSDFFCGGQVQLADGRILIAGGNAGYPNGVHGYLGLNTSYVFDPSTGLYTKLNNLTDAHWYPSATETGNGDVITLGGLDAASKPTTAVEYYSASQKRWLSSSEIVETGALWGMYPSMILMADGRLFYTGSHVFGSGRAGTGASIYDYASGTITDVAGLRAKDNRDQSMSVLLPPAQAQKVGLFGGGNTVTNQDAINLVDTIDLSQAAPAYVAGPSLPVGALSDGSPEPAGDGKLYVSTVLLPDGTVLETGGGLHKKADPVFEASIYDPVANTFTQVASDPVARLYHSEAILLPDGRVATFGSQTGSADFEMRISIFSPPYLFKGARPVVSGVGSQWGYGSTQTATVAAGGPIVRAELIRPAAVTHSSDPNQRFVDLPFTVSGATVTMNVPTNPNLLPPGSYMLFMLNAAGVPSVASWVSVH
jgi:hypothetical protein